MYPARKTISMIFASSPGWKRIEPMCTHKRAPFTVSPSTGRIGRRSRAIAEMPKRYLYVSSRR